MRALVLEEATGPAGLRLVDDHPEPEGGDGLVVVDVEHAGVGFVDWLVTKGEYQLRPELPFVPGTEAAGVERGSGRRVAVGAPFGAFAEVMVAPAFLAFELPDAVSTATAAAGLTNLQTAHLALTHRGRLAAGETVLVHGAAGGVGVASIQVAKALGAGTVLAVASTSERRELALRCGADAALDAGGDWVAEVRERTGGRGADVVIDPVGGEAFAQSLRCMAPFGRVLVIGFASGTIPEVRVNRLLLRHLDVIGVNYGGMLPLDQEFAQDAWRQLSGWMADGTITLPGVTEHPLADAPSVLEGFGLRKNTGKPVLRVR